MGRPRPISARTRPARTRRATARPRVTIRWLVVAGLAAALALVVSDAVLDAERARDAWGERVPVLVVSAPVRAGEPLADSVEIASWPAGLAPDSALSAAGELPEGALAAVDRASGEPVTPAALDTGPGSSRPLVAVATPGPRPELAVGDPVSLWATYDPSLAAGRPTTSRLDTEATVASLDDASVVVAVEPERVADVVEATALATVTVVSERR